jgi:hypothetical protein
MSYGRALLGIAAFLLSTLLTPHISAASTYKWAVDASGNWNDPANWTLVEGPLSNGFPSNPGDVAQFDNAFTADRQVIFPNVSVTMAAGRIEINDDNAVEFVWNGGQGMFLDLDNAGQPIIIDVSGTGAHRIGVRVLMRGNLVVRHNTPNGSLTFTDVLQEDMTPRSLTKDGPGPVRFHNAGPGGGTTVLDGLLGLRNIGNGTGPLVAGDNTGAAGSAILELSGFDSSTSDVLIRADGTLNAVRNVNNIAGRVRDVTIEGGSMTVTGTDATLRIADLTMTGGKVTIGGTNCIFQVDGDVTAQSTAGGPAILSGEGGTTGILLFTAGLTTLAVADGPQASDLRIDAVLAGGVSMGTLVKSGAGTLLVSVGNIGTSPVRIDAGAVQVTGALADVTLNGGTLSGNGNVRSLTGTPGVLSPGPGPAILQAASVALGASVEFQVDIQGTAVGTGYDQLRVASNGSVDLGGATLALTSVPVLPPVAKFTIVQGGTGSFTGTFQGLPEGALITTASGAKFTISYASKNVVLTNVAPPLQYFLSEGATGAFFDEDVLIANPHSLAAPVTLTFLLPGGGTHVEQRTVPATSRLTVKVDEIAGLDSTSPAVQITSEDGLPLAVERTMMWDQTHYSGHTANAVSQAEQTWYFAEGSQGTFFQTYLLLANPNTATVQATVTFLRENAAPVVETFDLEPQSRRTISAGDYPALVDSNFGMKVTAPQPITAERAMYFASTPGRLWNGGTGNVGSPAPSTSWFHPEGASGTFFTTFILLSNPQSTRATVTLRFLTDTGIAVEIPKTIEANQRISINPAAEGNPNLASGSFATVVTSDVPIVSERAMYWPGEPGVPFGEGHASSGITSTALRWALAEGRAGGPEAYTTYILLANPSSTAADVTVTYLPEDGAPIVRTYNIAGNLRFNIDAGALVPELQNRSFGALVEVTNNVPIAVERSLYWNANGIFWAGGTNALATPLP